MGVLDNKCPACGAKITFNPKNQMWDCEYCGSKFTLEEMQKHENASNEKVNAKTGDNKIKKDTTDGVSLDVYRCENCGAEIVADETVTATFCVYCGSTAILKDKIDDGVIPNLIIPFKNVKDDAITAFKKLYKNKLLVPKSFKSQKNIEKITGVYIPFWAYDLTGDGNISFNASDTRYWSDSQYDYTEISRYLVEKSGHFEYDKVLADASSRFADDLMDSLEPFNYNDLVEYNHAYLSGFFAEKYDVLEDACLERAEDRSMNTCVSLVSNSIPHQSKMVLNNNIKIIKNNSYYLMLPVWMLNVKYRDKMYTFAMNGQTGKIIGNLPVGIKETIIASVLVFVGLFLIATLIVYFVS